jgi:hypothetical protein
VQSEVGGVGSGNGVGEGIGVIVGGVGSGNGVGAGVGVRLGDGSSEGTGTGSACCWQPTVSVAGDASKLATRITVQSIMSFLILLPPEPYNSYSVVQVINESLNIILV